MKQQTLPMIQEKKVIKEQSLNRETNKEKKHHFNTSTNTTDNAGKKMSIITEISQQ